MVELTDKQIEKMQEIRARELKVQEQVINWFYRDWKPITRENQLKMLKSNLNWRWLFYKIYLQYQELLKGNSIVIKQEPKHRKRRKLI